MTHLAVHFSKMQYRWAALHIAPLAGIVIGQSSAFWLFCGGPALSLDAYGVVAPPLSHVLPLLTPSQVGGLSKASAFLHPPILACSRTGRKFCSTALCSFAEFFTTKLPCGIQDAAAAPKWRWLQKCGHHKRVAQGWLRRVSQGENSLEQNCTRLA